MARQTLVLLMLAQPAWSLQLPARAQGGHSRRAALGSGALAAAAVAVAQLPLVASADTMAAMEGTMQGFDSDEIKRAKYQEMQKTYKKAWRKQLSNLEYASSDAEALEAIRMIMKMVRERNGEIPQGVRKQDLDQVYKRVKDSLSKPTRMAFLELDQAVRSATTVKDLRADD